MNSFSPFILPSPVLLSSAAVILLCNHTDHTRRNHTLMKKTNTKQSIQKAPLKCWHAFYETTVSRRDAQGDSWKKILSVLHLSLHICTSYSLFHLNGSFNQKCKFCHHLLTLKYFQTCMNVFVLLNTKGRYSEECGKQSSSGAPLTFIVFFFPTMEVNCAPKQPGYKLSSKYLPLCLAEQRNSYRFGTTSGWVNYDRIFIFGWTIPLSLGSTFNCTCLFFCTTYRSQ